MFYKFLKLINLIKSTTWQPKSLHWPIPAKLWDQDDFWKFATSRWSAMKSEDITVQTLLSLADEAAHAYLEKMKL